MSRDPVSVPLLVLSAFINQRDKPYLGGMLGFSVVNSVKQKNVIMCKNERCYSSRKVIIQVTPSVVFSLLALSISAASPLWLSFLSSPPFLQLMKGFIYHPAGDECDVSLPDLYSVTNKISAMLPHAPTTKLGPGSKIIFQNTLSGIATGTLDQIDFQQRRLLWMQKFEAVNKTIKQKWIIHFQTKNKITIILLFDFNLIHSEQHLLTTWINLQYASNTTRCNKASWKSWVSQKWS